jgi:hypothetical protein
VKHVLLGVIFLFLAGCGTHYYKISGNSVSLFLKSPDARKVYFASSLNQYKLQPAEKMKCGVWEIEVSAAREFRYFYKVDGVVYLPDCRLKERDDFGAENCVFVPNM